MKRMPLSALIGLGLTLGTTMPAQAQFHDCEMTFSLSGWSAFYKTASGLGTVTCSNGQRMRVKLSAKGGGHQLRQVVHRQWPRRVLRRP